MQKINGALYAEMIRGGAASLCACRERINDLNVFPIPDGDTGDNMLMTIEGGVPADDAGTLSRVSEEVADGMLLSARGNSGVILSQFFEGVRQGLAGHTDATAAELAEAFRLGVKQAYAAVMQPKEGTVLTVLREATEYAGARGGDSPDAFLADFLEEGERSLDRTPELLPVLAKAGVVDSGGAGLLAIVEGMLRVLRGEEVAPTKSAPKEKEEVDLDAFGTDSVLEFGYCTELLLRLQRAKVDLDNFDVSVISHYLESVGDSVVAVQSGTAVKLHVHTKTPHEVLAFCQRFGEFLKVKIENMQLQHNAATALGAEHLAAAAEKEAEDEAAPRRPFAAIAVASGEGLRQVFLDRGCAVVVDGGQSMNPSAEELLAAIHRAHADTVFVFPNNSNIILAAQQAKRLCEDADVRVIPSVSVGQGYAALSMYDETSGDADVIEEELNDAMEGVLTAEISRAVREADFDGAHVGEGDYIGFMGKELLAVAPSREEAVLETAEKLGLQKRDILLLVCGKAAEEDEVDRLYARLQEAYRTKEIYVINGGQDVYDYILIVE